MITENELRSAVEKEQNLYRETYEKTELEKRYVFASIPKGMWDIKGNSIPNNMNYKSKVEKWFDLYSENINKGKYPHGLFLYGEPGTGKSSLGVAILKRLIKYKQLCCFINYIDLLNIQKETDYYLNCDETLWEWIQRVPVLMIDDIYANVTNKEYENILISKLEEILRKRIMLGVTNIFTSNLTISAIRHKNDRLASLLEESCFTLEIKGMNFRSMIQKKNVL